MNYVLSLADNRLLASFLLGTDVVQMQLYKRGKI